MAAASACNLADPYVGGLAEAPQGRAHMGPLFVASITEQFIRLRDADWWYFENGANNKLYTDAEIEEIKSTSKQQEYYSGQCHMARVMLQGLLDRLLNCCGLKQSTVALPQGLCCLHSAADAQYLT